MTNVGVHVKTKGFNHSDDEVLSLVLKWGLTKCNFAGDTKISPHPRVRLSGKYDNLPWQSDSLQTAATIKYNYLGYEN